MRPCTPSGISGLSKNLPRADDVAGANALLRQVSVPRLPAAVMVDDDRIAVTVLDAGKRNDAIGCCLDVVAVCHRDVDAFMERRLTGQRILSPSKPAAQR